MKKKLLAALLATAMTVTMFAGCGTPGSKDSKKDDSSASSGKKRITYTLREDLPSMDPQNSNSISCATAEICTYAMLTRNVEGEVKPDAAESWDISDDGLTYTFHLRDGLKWSDGEDVKAGDYVYGIQRLMDPEMASDYAFIGYILKNGAEVNKVLYLSMNLAYLHQMTRQLLSNLHIRLHTSLVWLLWQHSVLQEKIM